MIFDSDIFLDAERRYWNAGVINLIDRAIINPSIPKDVIEIPKISLITINRPTAITDPGIAYPIEEAEIKPFILLEPIYASDKAKAIKQIIKAEINPRKPEFKNKVIFLLEKKVIPKSLQIINWISGNTKDINSRNKHRNEHKKPVDVLKDIFSKMSFDIDPIFLESVKFLLNNTNSITNINKIPASLAPL